MVDTGTVQMVSWVWLRGWEQRDVMNIYIKFARFFSEIFCLKIPFESRHVTLLSFTHKKDENQYHRQKIPALFCVKLTSTTNLPRCDDSQYI